MNIEYCIVSKFLPPQTVIIVLFEFQPISPLKIAQGQGCQSWRYKPPDFTFTDSFIPFRAVLFLQDPVFFRVQSKPVIIFASLETLHAETVACCILFEHFCFGRAKFQFSLDHSSLNAQRHHFPALHPPESASC